MRTSACVPVRKTRPSCSVYLSSSETCASAMTTLYETFGSSGMGAGRRASRCKRKESIGVGAGGPENRRTSKGNIVLEILQAAALGCAAGFLCRCRRRPGSLVFRGRHALRPSGARTQHLHAVGANFRGVALLTFL